MERVCAVARNRDEAAEFQPRVFVPRSNADIKVRGHSGFYRMKFPEIRQESPGAFITPVIESGGKIRGARRAVHGHPRENGARYPLARQARPFIFHVQAGFCQMIKPLNGNWLYAGMEKDRAGLNFDFMKTVVIHDRSGDNRQSEAPRLQTVSSSLQAHRCRSEEHTSELQSLRHLVCR